MNSHLNTTNSPTTNSTTFYQKLSLIYSSFSPMQVLTLWSLFAISFCLALYAFTIINNQFIVKIPALGGTVTEGIVGNPRFINPILAITEQDLDLTSLVFSGLTRRSEDGEYVQDIASSIETSPDGLSYTVNINQQATFHDGTKVSTEDIAYTVLQIQDPLIKSPHRIEWEGITISVINEHQIQFNLKKPYPRFLESLSVGILPKHRWKNITPEQFSLSDFNIEAIGAGPFEINEVVRDLGIPKSFSLNSNKSYTLGRPHIDKINFTIYQNEKQAINAFQTGEINRLHNLSHSKTDELLKIKNVTLSTSTLPRTVTIFFNPNKNQILADKTFRLALNKAIDRTELIEEAINGYGKTTNWAYPFYQETSSYSTKDEAEALKLFKQSQASKSTSTKIALTISTANTEEMRSVANQVAEYWNNLGIQTTVNVYEVSDLNLSIIKNRDFEVLLFPINIEDESELYSFWHSTQRTYPGLNITSYVSQRADASLDILMDESDKTKRDTALGQLLDEINNQSPAIFLYTPFLTYLSHDGFYSPIPSTSQNQSSRWGSVSSWYKNSELVWKNFNHSSFVQTLENFIH